MTSTIYRLGFSDKAAKEWRKLDPSVKDHFSKKLRERLSNPRVPSAALHGMTDCYKIKAKSSGYRLVYQVNDRRIIVIVIAVGKRDGGKVYETAAARLDEFD